MVNKSTTRLTVSGERFEILVDPDAAFKFKKGSHQKINKILVVDQIFTDANKGLRASEEKLRKAFNTTNVYKIAEKILKQGELQLTTEQRRKLVEEKRKQIIAFISRHCIDPRTGFPHPPLRIMQAIDQLGLVVNPFIEGEEQARVIIDKLRPVLPIKMEQLKIAVKISPEYASQAIGVIKNFAIIKQEEWQSDGSWIGIIEMAAGLHGSFLERVGSITHGDYQTKILKK